MILGVQTHSAAVVARELDIHWVVHRIVCDQLDDREVCAHWVPKNPTDDDKAHCIGLYGIFLYPLDMLQWSKRAVLERKHGYLHKTWNWKKDVIEKLSSPSSKENGSTVFSKDDCGKLSWDHKHVLVLDFLDHGDIADCYSGKISLWWPFFAKGLGYFTKVLSFCMTIPGVIHPTGLTAIYGCKCNRLWISPVLHSVFHLSLNSWEAPGRQVDCSRCWWEARYHLLATDTQQQCLYPEIQTLVPLWGKCWDGGGNYVEVWSVPSASHVPCIGQSHNNILAWECLLPYFLKVLCIYIAVWAGEFINTGCSEWGVSVSFVDNFYSELFVLVVTFTLLCPHNFVTRLSQSRRIFKGNKILSTPSFGGEVKPSVPCHRFAACKGSLKCNMEVGILGKNYRLCLLPT